ncbi:MAG: MBL fold metallo-hydrolase [Thermoplasmatota archaeon]
MVEIRKIAHASVLIKDDKKDIYIDPFCSDSFPDEIKQFYEYLDKADLLLLTHEHHDHCDPSTYECMLTDETEIVAPESCGGKVDRSYTIVKPGDLKEIDGVKVKAVHAYNEKRKRESGEPFHPKSEGVGYVITIDDKTIYHPGDTENIPEMKDLKGIDVAFLPIDGTYTMDIGEAVEAAEVIGPKIVIPIHERDADPEEFKEKLEAETDIEVKTMKDMDTLKLR